MPTHVAGPLVSQLLHRIRDPHATGTSRSLARKVLSYAQNVINTHSRFVVVDETLTTEHNRLIYPVVESLPLSARILAVFDANGAELYYARDWKNLANFNSGWFRDIEPQHTMFSMIGRDLLVLYPAKDMDSIVTVRSAKLLATLISDDGVVELHESNDRFLLDMSELVLLVKNRRLAQASSMLAEIKQRLRL